MMYQPGLDDAPPTVATETPEERRQRLALEKAKLAYSGDRKKEPGWKRPPDGTGRVFKKKR